MELQVMLSFGLAETTLSIAALLFLAPTTLALYNLYLHPLRHYPGPAPFCAFRLRWVMAMQSGDIHRILLDLHNKYGPIVRIAPNELSYIDPQAVKDIYQNPRIHRAEVWFPPRPGEPFTIMSADEDAHAKYKKAFLGGFTEKAIREHSSLMEKYVELMINKLIDTCTSSPRAAAVDIIDWLNMVTFDISGDLSFGSPFGSIQQGKAHPWVDISNQFGKGIALMASLNFYPGLVKLLKYSMPRKAMQNLKYHKKLTTEKLAERLETTADRKDFIQSILDHNADSMVREKVKQVSRTEIEVNMPVVLFAGSETTSSAIGSTLWYLLRNPKWLDRAQVEIRGAFSAEAQIIVSGLSRLEVLTAIISEGLRLGPPSVIGVPRITGKGGDIVCGRFVPGGTMLAMSQYPAFRSATNFRHPEAFDPGRFLASAKARVSPIFRPFLVGRHVCIGERFAWAEMRLIIARLLFSFDITLDEGSPSLTDWGEQKTFIFWQKEPLRIKLKPRRA
ncbi:hypothetical protein DOTSEDRAFT_71240 [Dothistroma septosporum NZE10]|uniref:Uncharacterized protein n=1 Tax=Dothistroma septosporum (strain NZE10 / CBS 128990) TaxID=675120 RepID=N1PR78_DOTSN|nr:hypothetical protein DOTSEDRAFT_71240 [Dothistroma septosporum NZE10]